MNHWHIVILQFCVCLVILSPEVYSKGVYNMVTLQLLWPFAVQPHTFYYLGSVDSYAVKVATICRLLVYPCETTHHVFCTFTDKAMWQLTHCYIYPSPQYFLDLYRLSANNDRNDIPCRHGTMSEPILNQYYICSGPNQSWTNSEPILWLHPFGHRTHPFTFWFSRTDPE